MGKCFGKTNLKSSGTKDINVVVENLNLNDRISKMTKVDGNNYI